MNSLVLYHCTLCGICEAGDTLLKYYIVSVNYISLYAGESDIHQVVEGEGSFLSLPQ